MNRGRRRAGPARRGGRPRAAGRVHRAREAADRHARGRARDRRLARRAAAPARGAHDRQAPRRARACSRTATRGRLHPLRAPRCSASSRSRWAARCAEELFFGDVSTGPAGDLLYATNVAAQMVGAAGMTDTLVSFAAVQGAALSRHQPRRPGARRRGGPRRGWRTCCRSRRRSHQRPAEPDRHLVAALRDALLERHELIGTEITDVLEAASTVVDLRDPAMATDRG